MKLLFLAVLALGSVSAFAWGTYEVNCEGVGKAGEKCMVDAQLEDAYGTVKIDGHVQCYNKQGGQTYVGGIQGNNFIGMILDDSECKSRFMITGDNLSNNSILKVHIGIPGEKSSLEVAKLKLSMPVNCTVKRI